MSTPGIAVCAAGNAEVTLKGPVNAYHLPIVVFELAHLDSLGPEHLIEVQLLVVGADGNLPAVVVPGVAASGLQGEAMLGHGFPASLGVPGPSSGQWMRHTSSGTRSHFQ